MQQQHQLNEDLLSNLSYAVQEIQAQFARGTDVIWNCCAVDRLCYCMEDILSHGLKEGLLSWASSSEISFWSLAVRITCKKDIQDILRLNLKNDSEKCMSWIRQGLRENTLGSYINVITQDEKLLREFYHSYAFLCDSKKAETVKNLLTYGISHLDFDISLSSNTRRPVTTEARPVLASDMMIVHLPLRQSDPPNGYTSSFDSLNNSTTTLHVHNEETVTRKKRKKKKKAEVAMISESVDTEDSQGIDQAMQMRHDLHQEESCTNLENSLFPSEQASGNETDKIFEENSDHIVESAAHYEEVRATGVVLTMELPATQTVLQEVVDKKPQDESKSDSERTLYKKSLRDECYCVNNATQDAGNADDVSLQGNTNDSQFESNACHCADVLLPEGFGDDKNHFSKENVSQPVPLQTRQQSDIQQMEDEVYIVSRPSVEETLPLSDDCSSNAAADMSSEPAIEKKHNSVTDDSESVQHRVALATFECGTPKKIDDISEIEKERAFSSTSYEGEDFNIIPGIHKSDGKLSRSGSSGSFAGSGSFHPPSRTGSRNNTMDSLYRSSTFGSSATSDSWKYGTGLQSGLSRKDSKAEIGIGSPSSEDHFSEFELFDDLLGLEEDHFSPPESFMGVSTSEELEHAIQSCKDLISTTSEDSEEKQKLINKLVQLRLRLQETRDTRSESDPDATKVLGHLFNKVEERGNKTSCDKCGKTIWIWQSLFTCKACNYHSHRRCLDMIRRPCASRKVSVSTYNVDICPETGLSSQQFKCAECRKQIGLTRGERSEARLCDYTGQYYCEECHWNDLLIIPARVVHNWDFTSYKVSRQAKQLLALMISRPLLKIEKLNPALLKFVVELREVKRLREEVLIMKKYFMACRQALDSKLLLQLKDRQHFVDSSNLYSLQDLIDVNSGSLLPFLTKIHSLFLTHIKSDCPLCQAKGFVCELCQSNEVIFAFDPHVSQCTSCRSVYHKTCFKAGICPKCERRHKRAQTSQ